MFRYFNIVLQALQLHNRSLVQPAFFPTSLSALDKQLHGGLACGTITEVRELLEQKGPSVIGGLLAPNSDLLCYKMSAT